MSLSDRKARFTAKLLSLIRQQDGDRWAFVILPKDISDVLPRRGRTTVECVIREQRFLVTLEPDGRLSHWLKIDEAILIASGIKDGDHISLEIALLNKEPEPLVPDDLGQALELNPEAYRVWCDTTTIARLDWIHWIASAKQAKTRVKRVKDACEMLASGKKRVCCFDPSGYYSKAFCSPDVKS